MLILPQDFMCRVHFAELNVQSRNLLPKRSAEECFDQNINWIAGRKMPYDSGCEYDAVFTLDIHRFLKAAAAFGDEPWCLTRARDYLQDWVVAWLNSTVFAVLAAVTIRN